MNTPNFLSQFFPEQHKKIDPDRLAARKARLSEHVQMLRELAQAFEQDIARDDMEAYEDGEFSSMVAHLAAHYLRSLAHLAKD